MYPMHPTLTVMYVTERHAELARRSALVRPLDADCGPRPGRWVATALATLRRVPRAARRSPARAPAVAEYRR